MMSEKLQQISQAAAAAGEEDFLPARLTARSVIEGLMEIAELAMSDTYFQSDRRVNAARNWLRRNP